MSEQNIDITLRTLGADAAAAEITKVVNAEKPLNDRDGKAPKINAEATAQRGLNQAKEAELKTIFQKIEGTELEAQMERDLAQVLAQKTQVTAVAMDTANTGAVKLSGSSRQMSQFITQAGYQVTDFTTQVGGGQSAITAFAQQAPQLLGALSSVGLVAGPAAIALGVLSAAIPIVLFGGKALMGMISEIKAEAAGATLGADALAESLRKAVELDLQETIDDTNTARLAAIGLEQDWDLTKTAEAESSTASLTNAGKVAKARRLIAEVLGQEIDKLGEIKRIAEEEQQKRELATQQAITAEQKKTEDRVEGVEKLQGELEMHEKIAFKLQADLSLQQQRLELLNKQKKANEDIVKAASQNPQAFSMASAAGPEQQGERNAVAAAQKALKDPQATQEIANLKQTVDMLNAKLDSYTREQSGLIDRAAQKVSEAKVQLQDQNAATEVKIGELQETLAADTLQAKAQSAVEVAKASATELEDLVDKIEPSLASGKAAKDAVIKATEDGKITADEVAAVSANMSTLIGQVQSHTATSKLTVTEILSIFKTTQAEMARMLKTSNELLQASNKIVSSMQRDQTITASQLEQMKRNQDILSQRIQAITSRR